MDGTKSEQANSADALKFIILVGGPSKGTRFRPFSLELPKPLFPIAGRPMIYHPIAAAAMLPGLKEIYLLGYYDAQLFQSFIQETEKELNVKITYLQESSEMGTAGGINQFKDQILSGSPEYIVVMNCDVCTHFQFTLPEMLAFHKDQAKQSGIVGTLLGTLTQPKYCRYYGCLGVESDSRLSFYAEKPQDWRGTSLYVNGGIYVFSPKIFDLIGQAVAANEKERDSRTPSLRSSLTEMFRPNWTKGSVSLEQDVIMPATDRSDCRPFCVFINPHYWHQIKSAGMSIKCNEEYLAQASELHPELLTPQRHASIIGNVTIHPSAQVDPSAVIGPNVTIGQNVKVGRGVRVHNSIILDGAELQDYCCLRWTIIGWNCVVGVWARIEGIPNFSPDDPADTHPDGITILGRETTVAPGTFIYNSVVMSHKSLTSNCFGRVLL